MMISLRCDSAVKPGIWQEVKEFDFVTIGLVSCQGFEGRPPTLERSLIQQAKGGFGLLNGPGG